MKMIKGKKELKRYYNQEKIVSKYEAKRFDNTYGRLQHEIELEIINRFISKFKNQRLLEIAVGTGRVTRNIKGKGIGIDTSENMLKTAKKNAPGWKFIKMDVMNLKFKEKFDVVISLRLLRHFNAQDRKIAYKKISCVLSDKGSLIVDMPTGKHNALLEFIDLFKKQDKIYEATMPIKEMKKELNESGFDVTSMYNTKYVGLLFRAMCIINDNLGALYPFLKRRMDKRMNKLHLATNVMLIAKKKGKNKTTVEQ